VKKRVLGIFDRPGRRSKDDMMLDTDDEVSVKLGDEQAYVTDLTTFNLRSRQHEKLHTEQLENELKHYTTLMTLRKT
jgi:hypothetical protein